MADTYGASGTNTYTVKGVGGILSNEVNATTGVSQIYRGGAGTTQQSLGTYNPSTKQFTPDPNANLTDSEKKALSSTEGTKAITDASKETATKGIEATGVSSQEAQTKATQLVSPNTATSTDTTGKEDNSADPNKYDANAIANTQSAVQKNIDDMASGIGDLKETRTSYSKDLRYPEEMDTTNQDHIQFNMLKYEPSGLNLSNASTSSSILSRSTSSTTIGTVTMAIQGPISDSNTVGWNDGNMDPAKALGAVGALATIGDGAKGAGATVSEIGSLISDQNKALKTATKAYFAGQAVQNQEILSRTTGAIANPNIELLFNAPQLREFTFTFILSPRSESESTIVKKIIRFFKQGMSVQRASTGLFLKTPNTFLIKYMQKGDGEKGAKYLPQIKECALQNFTVDYTPAQTYSTFYNNSMTAYQLTMGFKELTPIYNDDYTALDGNSDDYIGY